MEPTTEELIARAEKKIDMFKPLVTQIRKLTKPEYLAWVHDLYVFNRADFKDARLFVPDWMEPLSKTVWWVIPLVWVPVCMFLWSWFWVHPDFTWPLAGTLFVSGLLAWTLIEYSLHRWVFHMDEYVPDHWISLTLHFLLHGVHHKVPADRYRLVMPPVLLAILASIVYSLTRSLLLGSVLPWHTFHAVFGAGLFGYVCYDMTHYSQHHAKFKSGYFKDMATYHMKHHYSGLHHLGYGITSKLWDVVFGTVLPVNVPKKAA